MATWFESKLTELCENADKALRLWIEHSEAEPFLTAFAELGGLVVLLLNGAQASEEVDAAHEFMRETLTEASSIAGVREHYRKATHEELRLEMVMIASTLFAAPYSGLPASYAAHVCGALGRAAVKFQERKRLRSVHERRAQLV